MIREVQKSPLLDILQSGRNFPDFFRVKIGGGGGYYRWNRMFILLCLPGTHARDRWSKTLNKSIIQIMYSLPNVRHTNLS